VRKASLGWAALAVAYAAFFVIYFRGALAVSGAVPELYQLLGLAIGAFFVAAPLFLSFSLKRGRWIAVALVVALVLEAGFFLLIPAISMSNQSASNGTAAWTTYGSPSWTYYCFGATMQVQTAPASDIGSVLNYSAFSGCPGTALTSGG